MHDGFVMRYRTGEFDDGLPPGEGTFLACSFWMVDNLALQGRVDAAHAMYERLLSLANDVGLLSEEYDPAAGRLVGNFPQAFSHVALVHTGLNLMKHEQEMNTIRRRDGWSAISRRRFRTWRWCIPGST